MIYPIGTIATLSNKDGTLDDVYVGREVTILAAPNTHKVKNRYNEWSQYEGYIADVEGEASKMIVKHVWVVPRKFPENGLFTTFMDKVLSPVSLEIEEKA